MKRTVSVLAVLALLVASVGAVPHADDADARGTRSLLQRLRSGGTVPRRYGGHEVNTDGRAARSGRRPFPIVLPSETERTKLTLQREGLDVLRGIKGPIAPVVVIGPYRSGKSFLLNQMLGVSCGEGFGVGHTRKTETKGVWVWGEPMIVDGDEVNVVFVDTEGFEATGMSDAYDDRIFALSSIMSSVLVYNLPETVKEGDIEKLSFAVELAQEFYTRASAKGGGDGGGDDAFHAAVAGGEHSHELLGELFVAQDQLLVENLRLAVALGAGGALHAEAERRNRPVEDARVVRRVLQDYQAAYQMPEWLLANRSLPTELFDANPLWVSNITLIAQHLCGNR